jgi:hypothetical protein
MVTTTGPDRQTKDRILLSPRARRYAVVDVSLSEKFSCVLEDSSVIMALIVFSIRKRIETRKQVLIRVHPDEPLAGVTDPAV